MATFKPKPKNTHKKGKYEYLSVNAFSGEKEPLIRALNKIDHPYTSFAQFTRDAINLKLEHMGSSFRLTVR